MNKKDVAIIGLGGVGGYFGFKLAQKFQEHEDIQISFVVREPTYTVVKEQGLTLHSPEKQNGIIYPKALYKSLAESAAADLYVICVKGYDLEKICRQLKEKVQENTVIIPLMNGIDVYQKIRKILPQVILLPSCVYVASHIKQQGVVEHKGIPGKIIIGKDPQHPEYHPREIVALFKQAAIAIEFQEDAFPAIWTKFFFIASFGMVSARYNKSIGQINEDAFLVDRTFKIMKEIEAIASIKGVKLPTDIIEKTFETSARFPYETPTSLQLDVHAGKTKTELEAFAGAIIQYGLELEIPVEETTRIYHEIKNLY